MTVVVGYKPTPEGDAALDRAVLEARRGEEDILLVNASQSDTTEGDPAIADKSKLAEVRARLDKAEIKYVVRQRLRVVSPADEILGAATDSAASAIVIGLRRRSRVGKVLFGSIAQTVLLEADCPVIAVKAR
ncbi:universal stress protein [Leekyejoonella antrihumi]|uniref:Universal stress protein n=1 Tax=Leekyejoonella antrihumi TaxID=1660198 RepID=A0A563DUN2_9MICO|nr:universal stress protein [Leekyejoonella antrihumi]TWP33671.1 universal stress protein [Leekyejoonella antrihumi]